MTFFKKLWSILFPTPTPFVPKTVTIVSSIHTLGLDDRVLFDTETIKLQALITSYIDRENAIFTNLQMPRESNVLNELLHISPVSVPSNLTQFKAILENTDYTSYYDVKRWQDFVASVYVFIHPDVIDVYMGRYFRTLMDHYWIPGIGLSQEDEDAIVATHEIYPWVWLLVWLQQNPSAHKQMDSTTTKKLVK